MLDLQSYAVSTPYLDLLKCCYRFVNQDWQHAVREALPDQGFEMRFRECCIGNLPSWTISQPRELHLGGFYDSASGSQHEIDVVASHPELTGIAELKNRRGDLPNKNDVVVFFAKILDYIAANSVLLQRDICPIFMSTVGFEETGLSACLRLGIHPISPQLRPLPILLWNTGLMLTEVQSGVVLGSTEEERLADYIARMHQMCATLDPTWFSSRCGYLSEASIAVRAVPESNGIELARELRGLNAECTWLLECLKGLKARRT